MEGSSAEEEEVEFSGERRTELIVETMSRMNSSGNVDWQVVGDDDSEEDEEAGAIIAESEATAGTEFGKESEDWGVSPCGSEESGRECVRGR